MVAELYPHIAPNTVNNFISLVKDGYYDGIIFHRVIKGFMIQGGCPNGNGMGGPGYSIAGEFSSNGFTNNLKHEKGVLSMARTMQPNSAGSQFFIMHARAPHLDGEYAAFGRVIEGLDVVDKIASVRVNRMDKPLEDQRIKSMTVETFGVEYPEVEKMLRSFLKSIPECRTACCKQSLLRRITRFYYSRKCSISQAFRQVFYHFSIFLTKNAPASVRCG